MNANNLLMTAAGLLAATVAHALPTNGLHPNSDAWPALFAQGLSDAEDTKGVWFRDADGNLTASQVPPLHTKPWAEIVKRGRIGLQGKHQGAATYFRNLRVQEGDWR